MTRTLLKITLVGLVVLPPCAPSTLSGQSDVRTDLRARSAGPTSTGPIGVATQDPDGTLVLILRAESHVGAVGDAQIRYAPSDPAYAGIARHLGPIPPGGSVAVRPFEER
jgi:hypothetical protein